LRSYKSVKLKEQSTPAWKLPGRFDLGDGVLVVRDLARNQRKNWVGNWPAGPEQMPVKLQAVRCAIMRHWIGTARPWVRRD
jgi:hypothetical protein